MASQSKKRKCKNTHYDRGGEKGKIHYLKGYAMYYKKERVANNKAIKEQENEMSKYRAVIFWSGTSEGYGDTEEEALVNAEYNMPIDANTDSTEIFCEDYEDEDEE